MNINKAIIDLKKQKDFEMVNELETAKISPQMSRKMILYGLFHN